MGEKDLDRLVEEFKDEIPQTVIVRELADKKDYLTTRAFLLTMKLNQYGNTPYEQIKDR